MRPSYQHQFVLNNRVYLFGQTKATGTTLVNNANYFHLGANQFIAAFTDDLTSIIRSTIVGTGKGTPDISPTAFLIDVCEKIYISNGGIYGSMLSTPILNPPQSGVLGMHNIVDRATIVDGEIVARPIMYVALSYDHRIIDGKEAVSFLKCVKDYLEEPRRLFLDL